MGWMLLLHCGLLVLVMSVYMCIYVLYMFMWTHSCCPLNSGGFLLEVTVALKVARCDDVQCDDSDVQCNDRDVQYDDSDVQYDDSDV